MRPPSHRTVVTRWPTWRQAASIANLRRLHAGAVVHDLALSHQLLQRGQHRLGAGRVDLAGVQLVQVDPVGPKPTQARLAGPADVAGADVHAAAGPALLVKDQAELGGDHDLVAHAGKGPAEHAFAVAAAVHVGGVEQADPKVDGPPDGGDRLLVVDLAPAGGLPVGLPRLPDRPAAKPQRAHHPPTAPQGAGHRHVGLLPLGAALELVDHALHPVALVVGGPVKAGLAGCSDLDGITARIPRRRR
jgi:hypothetical protein